MYTPLIINHRDLYDRIHHIRIWSDMLADLRAEQRKRWTMERLDQINAISERIITAKRAVRKYLREERETEPVRTVQSDWDNCIILVPMSRTITDAETAEAHFREFEYIPRPCSAYDCTGREYTRWYRIVERHGRYYVYHAIGLDV